MVSELCQDSLNPVTCQVVGDEGTTKQRERFSISGQFPKGECSNFRSAAESWYLEGSTYRGHGVSFEHRLRNESSDLRTAPFGAALEL